MFNGTTIDDLIVIVERAEVHAQEHRAALPASAALELYSAVTREFPNTGTVLAGVA